LITHRFEIGKAVAAYEMILKGKERYIGVLINYPETGKHKSIVRSPLRTGRSGPEGRTTGSRSSIGYIGAGLFTRNFLLPRTKAMPAVTHIGIASQTALSARNAADRFGFGYATTDYRALLDDPEVGSLFVTTRHNLHGRFVTEALAAGKSVFVEKPLCISREELEAVQVAYATAPGRCVLMVGFNRRFAPLAQRLKDFMGHRTSPLQMIFRVNAGYIPPDHWTQDPAVGGGRIIGEACHYIDFFTYLTGSAPLEVSAASIGGGPTRFLQDDNVSLTLRFGDGSLGTIIYTALGSKTFSRERCEVYCEERVGVLEDFRTLELIKGSRKDRTRLRSQDMGYAAELEQFFRLDRGLSDELFRDAALTTAASFAAVESLHSHQPISVLVAGEKR
jgi:predicted dehydrogenase